MTQRALLLSTTALASTAEDEGPFFCAHMHYDAGRDGDFCPCGTPMTAAGTFIWRIRHALSVMAAAR